MTRLGGFGFVCQIRRDKLLNLMQENGLTVQGNSLVAPFRLALKGPPSGLPPRRLNSVDLLVKSIDLALEVGSNKCTLVLHLEGGVIRLPGAPEAPFTGGSVNVQVQLLDGTFILARVLGATLDAPTTAVTAGIANFAARANAEVDKLVNAERNVDVNIYPDAGPIDQILVIFSKNKNLDANTFSASIGGSDAGTLTSAVDLTTSVSYAISAPEIISTLPTAEQLSRSHVTITEVNYGFRDSAIDVTGRFDGHDTCWSVSGGSFSQTMIPWFANQTFTFSPLDPTPKIDCDLELNFLCVVGKAAIDFLDFALTQAFFIFFGPLLAPALGIRGKFDPPKTDAQQRPGLIMGGVTWNNFEVSSEGFILLGDRAGGGLVSPVQQPAIHLRTKRDPANLHVVGQGTVVVQGPTCEAQSFDYVESTQDDQCTLTIQTDWVFEPVEYTWTVNGEPLSPPGDVVLGGNGRQQFNFAGTVTMPFPAPNGTPVYGHAIQMTYGMAPGILSLFARHEDAQYQVRVEVRAVDALGRRFSDAVNLEMNGDIVDLGSTFDDYMDACVKAATDGVNKKGTKSGKVKPGEPQEHWKNFVEALALAAVEGNVTAQASIPGVMRAVGARAVGKSLQRI